MQKVAHCQPFKLISFAMLLWQDTLCQVLHKQASSVFTSENNIIVLPVYSQMVGFALGLD